MPQIITTKGTAAEIERIISSANTLLVIVTAYMDIDEKYLNRLKAAHVRGGKVMWGYRAGD